MKGLPQTRAAAYGADSSAGRAPERPFLLTTKGPCDRACRPSGGVRAGADPPDAARPFGSADPGGAECTGVKPWRQVPRWWPSAESRVLPARVNAPVALFRVRSAATERRCIGAWNGFPRGRGRMPLPHLFPSRWQGERNLLERRSVEKRRQSNFNHPQRPLHDRQTNALDHEP